MEKKKKQNQSDWTDFNPNVGRIMVGFYLSFMGVCALCALISYILG